MARLPRSRSRSRRGRGPTPTPAVPFAVALFYQPSLAAAIAAGVKLPQPGVDPSIYAAAVRSGVVLPPSHIHVDPTAPPPDASPNTYPLLHSDIQLPATLYTSTADIHPKTFDLAKSFVRIQTFDADNMYFPDPAPGDSTAAILCNAGDVKAWEGPVVLRTFNVRRTSELRSVLQRDGPMLVRVLEVEELRQAPEVMQLLKAKVDQGWKCWPSINTIESLATLAEKAQDLHDVLLPDLRAMATDKSNGGKVKRRCKLLNDKSKSLRRWLQRHAITAKICGQMVRAVGRVHAKPPQRTPAFLRQMIDQFRPKILADLSRPVVFARPPVGQAVAP